MNPPQSGENVNLAWITQAIVNDIVFPRKQPMAFLVSPPSPSKLRFKAAYSSGICGQG